MVEKDATLLAVPDTSITGNRNFLFLSTGTTESANMNIKIKYISVAHTRTLLKSEIVVNHRNAEHSCISIIFLTP